MIKIVYVLVSEEKDVFYEQLLVSLTSLRYYTKDAYVVLITDDLTALSLTGFRSEIKNIVDKIIVHTLPSELNNIARSRILKTLIRKLTSGDFLYIDCDTVVCSDLSDIQKCKTSCAVLDSHSKITEKICEFDAVKERAKKFNYSCGFQGKHLNTGILWCKDNEETNNFFIIWNKLWIDTSKKGVFIDQLSFNEANSQLLGVFQELTGEWNCQLRYGLPFLSEAKIIHYFASNLKGNTGTIFSYCLTDPMLMFEIKEKHGITEKVIEIIKNPRGSFEKAIIVGIFSIDYPIMKSKIYLLLRRMYNNHRGIYLFFDYILNVFAKELKWIKEMLRTR